MKKLYLFLLLLLSVSAFMIACSEDAIEEALGMENEEQFSDENDVHTNEENEGEVNTENDDQDLGQEISLAASANILTNDGEGIQNWGEGVSLEAYKIDGSPAQLIYDTQFQDKGFGVAGARWHQIDYYVMYQGEEVNASEKIVITFDDEAENVVLTIGMLGLNEGIGDDDETGKWIAFNNNQKVAEGVFGPDDSDLGPENKLGGYGQYPFTLNTQAPITKIEIEATGFGYGLGEPKTVNSYDNESGNKENNSDFNIMALSFTKP